MRAHRGRSSKGLRGVRYSALGFALGAVLASCTAPAGRPDEAAHPAGVVAALSTDSVHYKGVAQDETEAWGPSALRAADDGTFWIVDTAADQLVHVGANGKLIDTLLLAGSVMGARDMLVREADLFVLDGSAMRPHVVRYSFAGHVLDDISLPDVAETLVDGFLPSPDGRVLLQAGGVAVFELKDGKVSTEMQAYALGAQRFSLAFPGAEGEDLIGSEVKIGTGRGSAHVAFEHFLSSVRLLRVLPNGESFVSLEEVAFDPQVFVDATVVHLSAGGSVLGRARLPVADQFVFVEHAATVDVQGRLYALHTREDSTEIEQLAFQPELEPVLDERIERAQSDRASMPAPADQEETLPTIDGGAVDVTGEALTSDTCRTTKAMIDKGFEYVNSATWLSSKNMDRGNKRCDGRKVPRYFTDAKVTKKQNGDAKCEGSAPGSGYECIRSVPYDWGGADTVATYRKAMGKGLQAGDIDTKNPVATDTTTAGVESCSHGTDCSGFVTRAWDLPSFYKISRATTKTLGNYSTSISGGAKSQPGCMPGKKMPKADPAQAPEITTACKNAKVKIETGDILLKAGSHVTLFRKFGTASDANVDGKNVTGKFPFHFESTEANHYDRVSYMHWPWSRFDSFEPRRFKKVCQ